MTVFANLVRFYSTTTGTNNIVIGSAVSGYLSPSVADGSVVSYGIRDGANSEAGRGTVSGGILSRDTIFTSTAGGAKINLSGTEEVYFTFLAEDIAEILPVADTTAVVKGSADATKRLRFEVDGFTTGTTRVLTPPNADITIAGVNYANTFTQAQFIDGSADAIQLRVQGHSTQTTNLQEWQNSSGTVLHAFNGVGQASFGRGIYSSRNFAFARKDTTDTAIVVLADFDATFAPTGAFGTAYSVRNVLQLTTGQTFSGAYFGGDYAAVAAHNSANVSGVGLIAGQFTAGANDPITATIVNAKAVSAGILVNASTMTTGIAVNIIAPVKTTGAVTNLYGLYVNNISGASTLNYAIYTNTGLVHFGDTVDLASGKNLTLLAGNITTDTTTGTKIGTATTQKLGFWNATPIVQPTTAVAAATFVANTSGIVNDTATFDGYTIGQVVKALRNIGALA